jgi:hypothetical protein
MPWKACSAMKEKLQFVARRLAGEPLAELCREFGIFRETGYKIFDHYGLTAQMKTRPLPDPWRAVTPISNQGVWVSQKS